MEREDPPLYFSTKQLYFVRVNFKIHWGGNHPPEDVLQKRSGRRGLLKWDLLTRQRKYMNITYLKLIVGIDFQTSYRIHHNSIRICDLLIYNNATLSSFRVANVVEFDIFTKIGNS